MSFDQDRSVSTLFPSEFDGMDEVLRNEVGRDTGLGQKIIPGFAWRIIGTKANKAIHAALNFNVVELLARAWCRAPELHEYNDARKFPADVEWTVFLGQHELSSGVEPILQLLFKDINLKEERFTVEVGADVHSAVLSIRGGKITAIVAASCALTAQLKYKDLRFHNPLKTREFDLVQRYEFNPPGLQILSSSASA